MHSMDQINHYLLGILPGDGRHWADCLRSLGSILSMSESGDRKSADEEFVAHFLPIYDQYLDNAQILVESLSKDGILQAEKIGLISRYTQVFTFISCIIIFIFGFFLGYTR